MLSTNQNKEIIERIFPSLYMEWGWEKSAIRLYMGLVRLGLGPVILQPCYLLHSPSNWCGKAENINLLVTSWWRVLGRAFVNISANWFRVETWGKVIFSVTTCWRKKWQSISMCFILSWKTGLLAILIALVLSPWRGVELPTMTPNSQRRRRSQMISALANNITQYSASAEDFETVVCFLHFHETRDSPTNMHQPVVDRQESGQPAQSTSA